MPLSLACLGREDCHLRPSRSPRFEVRHRVERTSLGSPLTLGFALALVSSFTGCKGSTEVPSTKDAGVISPPGSADPVAAVGSSSGLNVGTDAQAGQAAGRGQDGEQPR